MKPFLPAQALASLYNLSDDTWVAFGGSVGTRFATSTSDVDLFVIGSLEQISSLSKALARAPRLDLESMSLPIFYDLQERLLRYQPCLNGELPPFVFTELRFLARCSLGTLLHRSKRTEELLHETRTALRLAISAYVSSVFVNRYQDMVGLYSDKRYSEALSWTGELFQLACILGLLQTDLVDPTPKWGMHQAQSSAHTSMAAETMARHLGGYSLWDPADWVSTSLGLSNAVIAAGILTSGEHSTPAISHIASTPDLRYCLLGLPGYLALQDVIGERIFLANHATVQTYLDKFLLSPREGSRGADK